jgi:hypothetical protein
MAMSTHGKRVDQCEEGNAAGGHAGEVEAVPDPAMSPSMNPAAAHQSLFGDASNPRAAWAWELSR